MPDRPGVVTATVRRGGLGARRGRGSGCRYRPSKTIGRIRYTVQPTTTAGDRSMVRLGLPDERVSCTPDGRTVSGVISDVIRLRLLAVVAAGWCLVLAIVMGSLPGQCVWGGFDQSRLNYPGGVVRTGDHQKLRGILSTARATLATPTASLTRSYLNSIDVFYTSLLSKQAGTLSAAEQTELQAWVRAGGTLVVTGDVFPAAAYESFTAWLGITSWFADGSCVAEGKPLGSHRLTTGVTNYQYCTRGGFDPGLTANVLGEDANGQPFLVLEAGALVGQGRVLVVGDHNLFTDGFIDLAQNRILATNLVHWACRNCSVPASWRNFGAGLAGANGIPQLVPTGNPVNGRTLFLAGGSSSGLPSQGLLVLGFGQVSVSLLGGTMLVRPDLPLNISIPPAGFLLPVQVPGATSLCGVPLYAQLLQLDAGAAQSVSFSRGLELIPGH